jgi:hypothetical protein
MMATVRGEDCELSVEELERVSAGKTPAPGGPVAVPYPNVLHNESESWWSGTNEGLGR